MQADQTIQISIRMTGKDAEQFLTKITMSKYTRERSTMAGVNAA
jgi:hypothetical protein